MPRALRVLVEGGLYHVYNRFARGEEVFADPAEGVEFVELVRELKERDGFQVLAWSLLSNHYHLAIRTSAVPLSRTMGALQGGFARAFNRRWRRSGPLWQSRYQTRLVESQEYVEGLIFYIHLNPVRAGLVDDLERYAFCGHREMMGKVSKPLLDVDEVLVSFGETTKTARRMYLKRLNAALAEEGRPELPERLPWWKPERELTPATGRAHIDALGRSTGLERGRLEAEEYLEAVFSVLGIEPELLMGGRKDRLTMWRRELVATVGIERWGQRAGRIGSLLGKHPDVVSRWARMGATRRAADPEFEKAIQELDTALAESTSA